MEKIIATTDLSQNSRAGMRFAIKLAQSGNAAILFLHIHHVLRASMWSDQEYARYVQANKDSLMEELSSFVKGVYRSMKMAPLNYELAVHHNFDTVDGILEYAEKEKATYLCISTRGAGGLRKIFGTHTGKLIIKSKIPVLSVPSAYRMSPIRHVLYASDMTDYEAELTKVVAFAKPLKATVDMLHLSYPYEFIVDKELMEQTLAQKTGYKISLRYQSRDTIASLLQDLEKAINKTRPSVLVMFTNQQRDFFERLFMSSKAQEYALGAKIPLLSFNKMQRKSVKG